MSDITEQFQQTLHLVKQNQNFPCVTNRMSSDQVTRLNVYKEIFSKIRSMMTTINGLKDILIKNRKDYLNVYNPYDDMTSVLTDTQRDEIDNTLEAFQRDFPTMLLQIKLECKSSQKLAEQMKEHFTNVITSVEKYAKHVLMIFTEMKSFRVKRALDKQKVAKLAYHLSDDNHGLRNRFQNNSLEVKNENEPLSSRVIPQLENLGLQNDEESSNLLNSLTEEEVQAYEKENEQLFDEMNALNEEVKLIERQVVEIAQLQEMFTEKVLQQEVELNKVNMTVIGTTEDIKGGNQQLREAMKKNADFRVWILFFIIMLSFTILFLDWYNP